MLYNKMAVTTKSRNEVKILHLPCEVAGAAALWWIACGLKIAEQLGFKEKMTNYMVTRLETAAYFCLDSRRPQYRTLSGGASSVLLVCSGLTTLTYVSWPRYHESRFSARTFHTPTLSRDTRTAVHAPGKTYRMNRHDEVNYSCFQSPKKAKIFCTKHISHNKIAL